MQSNLSAAVTAGGGALELVSTSPDREFELVRQASAGNSHAFRELYRNNVKRVYAVCLRACRDRDTADELTQEVFVKAWEKLSSFKFGSRFSSWLHSIAVNQFLMMKRSEKIIHFITLQCFCLLFVQMLAAGGAPASAAASPPWSVAGGFRARRRVGST